MGDSCTKSTRHFSKPRLISWNRDARRVKCRRWPKWSRVSPRQTATLTCAAVKTYRTAISNRSSLLSDFRTLVLAQFNRVQSAVPFSAAHFPGHCFRLVPASCSFAASAFPVPPLPHGVPSRNAAARFGSSSPRFGVPQENGAEKGDSNMSYLYVKWNRSGQFAR
jgi:hypothetical protein